MKALICPYGNREKLKDDVRKDSAPEKFNVMKLMITITTIFF